MLKSVLLEWNKKHERFYLMNVGEDLQRILGAVLPAEVLQLTARGSLSSNCTKISLGVYFVPDEVNEFSFFLLNLSADEGPDSSCAPAQDVI